MNTRTITVALLTLVGLASTTELFAQRRRTEGPGSSERPAPSGGGSRSNEGERGGRRSSGSGSSSSSGSEARPAPAPSSPSSEARPAPESGKIGAARARARDVQARTRRGGGVVYGGAVYVGGCYSCYYWGGYRGRWGWYDGGWWYPARLRYPHPVPDDYVEAEPPVEFEDEDTGQGYQAYPYAEGGATGESFGQRRGGRAAYGAISGFYFADAGSTTRAGHAQFEAAIRIFRLDAEYGHYREPVRGGVDGFQTARFSVGIQPSLGPRSYLIAGIGARGLFLDADNKAGGPEGTLGVQMFPARPLGLNVTGRLAVLSWTGQDHFIMNELNTTGSLFLGRVELQAGWHWMKLEGSPAFGGPMVGTRIWF